MTTQDETRQNTTQAVSPELVEVAVLVDLLPVHEAHRDGAPGRELALAVLEKAVRVSHGKPP